MLMRSAGIVWNSAREVAFASGEVITPSGSPRTIPSCVAGRRKAQLCASACCTSAGHAHPQTPFCARTRTPRQQHLLPRHRRQYGVGLRWRSGRRIAEFASADEKGLAVNQELLSAVLRAKMRQIGRLSPGDGKEEQTNQSRTGSAHHIRYGPPHCDASGFPVGGGAWSASEGGPSSSMRTGFNASAQI